MSDGESNFGNYDVTATVNKTAAVNQNYDITVNGGKLNIVKASAEYSLSGNDHKVYDGQITNIDTVLGSYSVTLSNGEQYKLQAGDLKFNKDPKNKGNYIVSLTDAGINHIKAVYPNYDFSAGQNVTGTYQITAAPVTITVDSKTKVFGQGDPTLTAKIVGNVNGEKINYTISRVPGESVGQYNVEVSNEDNPNHDVTVKNGTLTVVPASATGGLSVGNKIYDGKNFDVNNLPTITLNTNGDLKNDLTQIKLTASDYVVTGNSRNVGQYVIKLTAAGINKIKSINSNFDFTNLNELSAEGKITPKPVQIKIGSVVNTYDGKAHSIPSSNVSIDGLVGSDQLDYQLNNNGRTNVGTSSVTFNFADTQANRNYSFVAPVGTITIKAANTTATLSGGNKVYDGKNISYLPTITYDDNKTINLTASDIEVEKNASNVGTYTIKLTAEGMAKVREANSNFDFGDLSQVVSSYVISAAKANAALTVNNKVYDGQNFDVNNAPVITLHADGDLQNNLSQIQLSTGDYQVVQNGRNVGSYTLRLTNTGISRIKAMNPNFDFINLNTVSAGGQITPKQVTVTANPNTKVYGNDDPNLTAKVDGLVDGDVLNYQVSRTTGENVGEYGLNITLGTNNNYQVVTDTDAKFTITPAEAIGQLIGHDKVYDGQDFDVNNLPSIVLTSKDGRNQSGLTQVKLTTGDYEVVHNGKNVGHYVIKLTKAGIAKVTAADPNFNFDNLANLTLQNDITPKKVTISANSGSKVYGTTDPELTATVNGLIKGDNLNYQVVRSTGENVGDYQVQVVPKDNPNYLISTENGQFTITPAQASYEISGHGSQVYNGQVVQPDQIKSGYTIKLSNGETYQLQNGDLEFDGDARNVGTYTVKLTSSGLKHLQMLNPNYDLVAKGQNPTFNIEKKKVTITVGNATKQVGAKDPDFNANVDGLISGDKLAYEFTREPGEKAGQYVINVALGANDNYDVQVIPGKLTIKATPEKITGTVTVHYVAGGRFIHADNHLKGIVGDGYEVKALSIPGYTLKRVVGEANGKFDGSKVVTFYYTVDYIGVPQTPNGKPIHGIKPIKGTGEPGSLIHAPEIPGYQFIGQAVIPNQPGQVALIYKAIEKPGHNGGGSHGTKEPNAKPEVIKPITPINNSKKTVKESTAALLESNSTAKRLPQTGDKAQEDSELFGLGVMALLGALGLVILKKRRSDD